MILGGGIIPPLQGKPTDHRNSCPILFKTLHRWMVLEIGKEEVGGGH
jgi:hypothetical protein